jgi:hypothetical protein
MGGPRARSVDEVLATITAQHRIGLVVQVGGNLGRVHGDGSIKRVKRGTWPTDQPLPTITTSLDRAIVLSNMAHNVPALSESEAMATITTGNKLGLVVPVGGQTGEARRCAVSRRAVSGVRRGAPAVRRLTPARMSPATAHAATGAARRAPRRTSPGFTGRSWRVARRPGRS